MSKDYLEQIGRYNVRQARLKPKKAALLVVDLQEYFRELAAPILENVLSLLRACREHGVPVYFTRHGHKEPSKDGGMLRVWWGDLIKYGSRDWELFGELARTASEPIVDKDRYSAFHGTRLESQLRKAGVEDLIVAGVMTNCCCETTARAAFVRDFRVFFASDATAAAHEELHLASLKNLAYAFAYVMSVRGLLRQLGV